MTLKLRMNDNVSIYTGVESIKIFQESFHVFYNQGLLIVPMKDVQEIHVFHRDDEFTKSVKKSSTPSLARPFD